MLKYVKLGSGYVFVVVVARVRVLTLIDNCHFNSNIAFMHIIDAYFGKVKCFFDVHDEKAFVLTWTVQFKVWALLKI